MLKEPPLLLKRSFSRARSAVRWGLQMKLVRTGDQLLGSYFYQKVGTKIELRGTLDKEGNVLLEELTQVENKREFLRASGNLIQKML